MKFIGSRSSLPLSILIRWVTGEQISHFAIVFDSPAGGLMFESNLLGTHPKFYRTAQKHMMVIDAVDVDTPVNIEDELWDRVVDLYDDKPYDFMGAIYLGLMILRKRIFGIPRPQVNAWASKKKFFCDELAMILAGLPGLPQIPVSNGMMTPGEVMNAIKEWKEQH